MDAKYKLINISGGGLTLEQRKAVSDLHASLLENSPVVMLGRPFMEDIYYGVLPCMGLVFGAIACVGNRIAGFILATDQPDVFMGKAIRRHWWKVSKSVVVALLRNPKGISAVWKTVKIMLQTGDKIREDGVPVGELLSFGVLPEFRDLKFVRETGLRISMDLLNSSIEEMKLRKMSRIRSIVDKDNLPAQLFYRGLGWELTSAVVPGWGPETVEFILHLKDEDE